MKKKYIKIISFLSIIVITICLNIFGQVNEGFENYSKLKLNVSTLKDNYLPLEPITFTFTFENQTNKPIKGRMLVNFSCCIEMEIHHNNETKALTTPSAIRKLLAVKPTILPSGASSPPQNQSLELQIKDIFPESGEYYVKFIQGDDFGEKVISNFVKIVIINPQGNDLEAFNFLSSKTDFSRESPIAENIGWKGNEQQLVLEEFLQRFGNTSYADYASYKLAQIYLRNKECEKSKNLLIRLNDKKAFQYSKAVEFYLERLDKKLNKCDPNEQKPNPSQ